MSTPALARITKLRRDVRTLQEKVAEVHAVATVSTDDGTETVAASIPIEASTLLVAGVRIIGHRASDDAVLIRELTMVFKRVGAATPVELGDHDSGEVRVTEEDADWSTDYAVAGTDDAIDVSVTGEAGADIDWTVEYWASSYALG